MLFNSLHYIIFFPIVVVLYFAIPYKYRWMLLLAASYYFYMCWKLEYIVLIMTSTLIDYFAGIKMGQTNEKKKRKKYLILSLISNFGLLGTFKYFNFFNESFRVLFNHLNIMYNVPALKVLLPVGISFYTFQTLSYSIDVYRGVKKPERNLGIFALYVAFFPQLVAGPIERSTRLLPQLFKKKEVSYQNFSLGMKQIIWGYFKKVVIADRLGMYVAATYNNQIYHSGITLLVATIFFSVQVYCDFSGYSDIAIGSARVMGYELMENFHRPYFSQSFNEFWRRWHISLSTWFKDYLYIPMGGSRVTKKRWYLNIMTLFLLSGLWHGANWTFVIWGAVHGFYMLFASWTASIREKISQFIGLTKIPRFRKVFKIIIFNILLLIATVFFRSLNISDAFEIIKKMAHLNGPLFIGEESGFIFSLFGMAVLFIREFKQELNYTKFSLFESNNVLIRQLSYVFLVVIILLIGVFDGGQFIYFQF